MAPLLSGNDGRLLQHRSFVSFWLARTSSSFGFQMLSIIVGWQIYSQTHSAFWLGMIGLVQFFPHCPPGTLPTSLIAVGS